MGTNYYAEPKAHDHACSHCSKLNEVHIGKSLTMFQGYVLTDPEWQKTEDLPFSREIRSWADWKQVLRSGDVAAVRDEYGHEHEIEEFIAHVEGTDLHDRGRQYRWVRDNYVSGLQDNWLDPDGFSFSSREFS